MLKLTFEGPDVGLVVGYTHEDDVINKIVRYEGYAMRKNGSKTDQLMMQQKSDLPKEWGHS